MDKVKKKRKTKTKKKYNFICKRCNYSTDHLCKWNIHILTDKHLQNKVFVCNCGKHYKHRSSLSRHQITCKFTLEESENENESIVVHDSNTLTNVIHTLIEENRELQNKLVDMAKEPRIINQTNNNQKTFNIIQFLNNDCKDAMNLSDFIKNLVVTFEDLEKIEEHGYLKGIKDSLIKGLHTMEQTKRPIHCTDIKRKQFYVKDENEWNKDQHCDKINSALTEYNNNQIKALANWKEQNPDWIGNQDQQTKVNVLMKEITSIYTNDGDKVKVKLLNHISEATTIDKNIIQ